MTPSSQKPSMLELRPARLADADARSRLAQVTYAAAFSASLSPEDLAAHLAATLSPEQFRARMKLDSFILAFAGRDIIGFVQFGAVTFAPDLISDPALRRPDDGQLRRLYVLASRQNLGLGSRLMDAALRHPRLRDCPRIYLDVWPENHGALRFYTRYGFSKVGDMPFYTASGEQTEPDAILARVR